MTIKDMSHGVQWSSVGVVPGVQSVITPSVYPSYYMKQLAIICKSVLILSSVISERSGKDAIHLFFQNFKKISREFRKIR